MRIASESLSMPAELRARLVRMRTHTARGATAAANAELLQVDRLLIAYPASEFERMRDRHAAAVGLRPRINTAANAATKDRP